MNHVTLVSSATCCCEGVTGNCSDIVDQSICVNFTSIVVREDPSMTEIVNWSGTASLTATWDYDAAAAGPPDDYYTLATTTIDLGGGYTAEVFVYISCRDGTGLSIIARLDIYNGESFITFGNSFPFVSGENQIGPFAALSEAYGSYSNDEIGGGQVHWVEVETEIGAGPCES